MYRIGLTGGIACGKSTVAARLREAGLPVLDADAVGRELTAPGRPLHAQLLAHFGPDVADAQGRLDRRRLRTRIMADPQARAELNALTHPAIEAALEDAIRALPADTPWVFVEAALLFEAHWERFFDAVVVVDAPPEVQVARLVERDGLTRDAALAALSAQLPRAERLARADLAIANAVSPLVLDVPAFLAALTHRLSR